MTSISLEPTTPRGDALCRLPLTGLCLAGAGEADPAPAAEIPAQMERLHAQIEARIAAEGMEVAVDRIDVRIAISRAILEAPEGAEVLIRIPVREAPAEPEAASAEPAPEATAAGADLFRDLFPLDEEEGLSDA